MQYRAFVVLKTLSTAKTRVESEEWRVELAFVSEA